MMAHRPVSTRPTATSIATVGSFRWARSSASNSQRRCSGAKGASGLRPTRSTMASTSSWRAASATCMSRSMRCSTAPRSSELVTAPGSPAIALCPVRRIFYPTIRSPRTAAPLCW